MKFWTFALALGAAGCSGLPNAGNGIVALEIRGPTTLSLDARASLTLHARALNLRGDSVAADVRWRTPDATLISLDSMLGVVTALSDTGGTARVQARVGTLVSDIISITLNRDTTTTTGRRTAP